MSVTSAPSSSLSGLHKSYEQRNLAAFVKFLEFLAEKLVSFQDRGIILLLAFVDGTVHVLLVTPLYCWSHHLTPKLRMQRAYQYMGFGLFFLGNYAIVRGMR